MAGSPKARWILAGGISLSVACAGMAMVLALVAPGNRTGWTEIPGTRVRFVCPIQILCDCGGPAVRGVVVSKYADGSDYTLPDAEFCGYSGSASECAYVRGEADAGGGFDLDLAGATVVVTATGCDPRVVSFAPEPRNPHRIRLDCPHRRAGPPETPRDEASLIAY